jgi:hypothetical protein
VPKANSKHGDFSREVPDSFRRNTSILDRFAGTGRDNQMIGLEGDQFVQRDLIVAEDADVRAELAEVLDEVVGEES